MLLPVRRSVKTALIYLALIVAIILSLFPLFWLFLTSIKPKSLTFAIPPAWIFPPTLENYQEVFLYGPFSQFFLNSIIVALGTTAIAITVGTLAAYAFARFNFRGSQLFQILVLVPQIIPPITIIIPLFVLFRSINMIDRTPSLIFTYLSFTIPLSIWMMIGFLVAAWQGDNPDPGTSYVPYKIYNIGNNNPVELLDFIGAIENALQRKAQKTFLDMQPGDVVATYADVDDLTADVGFKPRTPIASGIQSFIEWYREYYGDRPQGD